MSKPDYAGAWSMSKEAHRNFYNRWRQLMAASSERRYHMVANPQHAGYFKDLMEELLEDPEWNRPPPPEIMFVTTCPYDELVFWRADTGAVSLPEMIGRTGLGRFSRAAAPTREGVQPMDTMKVSEELRRRSLGLEEDNPSPLRGVDEERATEKISDEMDRQDREVYGD